MLYRLLLYSICCFLIFSCTQQIAAQEYIKLPVILDADTGNEVDDYFALAIALSESTWDIKSLNAAQWQSSQWAIPESMENSHRLNQVLLGEMGLDIPTKRGGIHRMYDWGDMAQHSAAAYEIIAQTRALPDNKKLNIIALGALTNVASALYIDPDIASRLTLYWLGTTYDFQQGILKRQDFNCMMDQQAVEVVLMSAIDLHIMPVNVAENMTFTMQETKEHLEADHPIGELLLDRWYDHLDGGRQERVIWDLALVQAIIHPAWAEKKTITTSKDYKHRTIYYYSSIDTQKMKQDFFVRINGLHK